MKNTFKGVKKGLKLLIIIYLSYNGRIGRLTYWVSLFPLFFFSVLLDVHKEKISDPIYFLIVIFLFCPAMMINIKRCHDRGRSGFFSLLLFVPVISFWPLIELSIIEGTEGDNKFGPDPVTR